MYVSMGNCRFSTRGNQWTWHEATDPSRDTYRMERGEGVAGLSGVSSGGAYLYVCGTVPWYHPRMRCVKFFPYRMNDTSLRAAVQSHGTKRPRGT